MIRFRSVAGGSLAVVLACGVAPTQDVSATPATAGSVATPETGAAPAAENQEPQPAATSVVWAQVKGEAPLELRCFQTDHSPHYEERLAPGDVVRVEEVVGDWLRIALPLGPIGYVHGKYLSELAVPAAPTAGAADANPADAAADAGAASDDDVGVVRSTGRMVSFRFRPQSGEGPVTMVDEGAPFHYLGRQGDWVRVRFADAPAWVKAEEMTVYSSGDQVDTLEAGWADIGARHRTGVTDAVGVLAQAAAEKAARDAEQQRFGELHQRFIAEKVKPSADQDYAALQRDLSAFVSALPTDSTLQPTAAALGEKIELQVTLLQAAAVVAEQPKPATIETPLPTTVDNPMRRFDAIGWLRVDDDELVLEKAGQVLFNLTCRSGRYDLRDFDGLEVGLVGPRERLRLESLRSLDVESIEVIGEPQR